MNVLKSVGLFVVGVGAGIFATRQYFKVKYENIANEEIESVKDTMLKRQGKRNVVGDCSDDDMVTDNRDEVAATVKEKESFNTPYTTRVKTMYNKAANKYNTTNPEYPTKEEFHKNLDKTKIPYIISSSSFVSECLNYEKITLVYYSEDDALTDDSEQLLDNADKLVGREYVKNFGMMGAGKDEVYVRNDYDLVDYEITRSSLSYKLDILGLEE